MNPISQSFAMSTVHEPPLSYACLSLGCRQAGTDQGALLRDAASHIRVLA
jgi:hypothetical protein